VSTWAVVLAGGVGSRFWPLSTPVRPKQLLPLVSERPLLVEAVDRLNTLVDPANVLILTNASLVDSVAALLPGIPRENIIAEPKPAGTAPALAWAAMEIVRRDRPDAIMVSVHADWAIRDTDGFRKTLARAVDVAKTYHSLVTVGVVPSRLDAGFGFIRPGDEVQPGSGVRRVAQFVEKPDLMRAREMTQSGYLWNSGIFAWRAGDFLDDIRQNTPEIGPALHAHANEIRSFFSTVTPVTVDVGVLERSNRVMVIAGDFGWDDVGTWARLRGVRPRDAQGNAASGDVHAIDSRDNVVHSEGPTVVLYGVNNLVVVAQDGRVVVTTVEKSGDLKHLIEKLPPRVVEGGGGGGDA
jgi:mannose-1-phosphate guanylyltransferase